MSGRGKKTRNELGRVEIREITRAAEEATAVATAAAAVAGAASVASAVRAQLAQRRDLPAAPSQTPMYARSAAAADEDDGG